MNNQPQKLHSMVKTFNIKINLYTSELIYNNTFQYIKCYDIFMIYINIV